jgi:hypothetical protein
MLAAADDGNIMELVAALGLPGSTRAAREDARERTRAAFQRARDALGEDEP